MHCNHQLLSCLRDKAPPSAELTVVLAGRNDEPPHSLYTAQRRDMPPTCEMYWQGHSDCEGHLIARALGRVKLSELGKLLQLVLTTPLAGLHAHEQLRLAQFAPENTKKVNQTFACISDAGCQHGLPRIVTSHCVKPVKHCGDCSLDCDCQSGALRGWAILVKKHQLSHSANIVELCLLRRVM